MKQLLFTLLAALTISNTTAQAPLKYDFPAKPDPAYTADAQRVYHLIENQARYVLSLVHPWNGDPDYKLTTASQGNEEHITRPNTGAVAIFAFLYRFGDYSPERVGMPREELLQEVIVPMIRYLVSVHRTGDKKLDNGKTWGGSWQSAHWTHQLTQAAATVWESLPEELQQGVLRVVRYEAETIAAQDPPYNLYDDSKSEENAWNAGAISGALMLMPQDTAAARWETALQRWLLSAYLCPDDAKSATAVDGRTVAEQYEGANIFNDYTLENHGLSHPDYMTAWTLKGEVMLDYLATGRKPLDACMHNVDSIYEQLKILLLPSGGFAYPSGQDWAIFRHPDWTNAHAFNFYYYRDPEALHWLRHNLGVVERMQARSPLGAVYAPNENYFPSSQTMTGLGLVDTWKMLMLAEPLRAEVRPRTGAKTYGDGKFFIRRTPNAVHTVAWGKKMQIQSFAFDADPMVAPDWQNGIGSITLAGEQKPLPLELVSIEQEPGKDKALFRLVIRHGDAAETHLTVTSHADGTLRIEERLTALRDIATRRVATLTVGLLNHTDWIEERGFRVLDNDGKELRMEALSGREIPLAGKEATIDGRLRITADRPIRGAYLGAKKWEQSKLIDRLVFNYIPAQREWKKGETISDQAITVRYEKR